MPCSAVVRESAQRLEAVREAVGEDIEIGVDSHARIFEPVRALEMAEALKPYRPFFFEEPLRPENIDALADVQASSPIPIATGEMLYTKFQFRELLEKQGADIIQPDVCIAGGLLEMKKIAAMAEAHYVTVAPHNPMGPVATAVNVHFAVSTPNFLILEYSPDDVGQAARPAGRAAAGEGRLHRGAAGARLRHRAEPGRDQGEPADHAGTAPSRSTRTARSGSSNPDRGSPGGRMNCAPTMQ